MDVVRYEVWYLNQESPCAMFDLLDDAIAFVEKVCGPLYRDRLFRRLTDGSVTNVTEGR